MPSLSNKAPPPAIHPSPLMPSYLENLHAATEVKKSCIKKKEDTSAPNCHTRVVCVCTRVKAREMDAGGG